MLNDHTSTNSQPRQPLFVVTVDTEADNSWARPNKIELKNLKEVPRFQALCQDYGIIPTYLVTYECATRDEAICVLKPICDAGQCEIGHHLHCWTTPPFEKEGPAGMDAVWLWAYQSELPDSLFREKAECLRTEIGKAYGKSPTSHRAGRWGIDQRTIDWLIQNGFVVESSVTPLTSWSKNLGKTTGGPSFYSSPREPHFWCAESVAHSDAPCLMEIPVTVDIPDDLVSRLCAKYIQGELPGTSLVGRIFRKVGGGRPLRPNPRYPEDELSDIVDRAVKHGASALNLMIHSSELLEACSPFSRTKDDCAQVWKTLNNVFAHVQQIGIPSVTLSDAAMSLRTTIEQDRS